MTHRISDIKQRVSSAGPLILDGALATELQRRGCDVDGPLWSTRVLLETPHAVQQLHEDYLKAGADCLITATYQTTFAGLASAGLAPKQAVEVFDHAVKIAIEARRTWLESHPETSGMGPPLIAASIGPYGAYRHDGSEYTGNYGRNRGQLADFHRERLHLLAGSGADLLACETIPSLCEAEALLQVIAEVPDTPVWMTFSCRDAQHLCHGEPIAECGQLLNDFEQVVAVGVNCTAPQFVEPLIEALADQTTKPIIVYPNSGETWNPDRRCWTGTANAEEFAQAARRWQAAGARMIGGCCRTGPEHIRQIATALAANNNSDDGTERS